MDEKIEEIQETILEKIEMELKNIKDLTTIENDIGISTVIKNLTDAYVNLNSFDGEEELSWLLNNSVIFVIE